MFWRVLYAGVSASALESSVCVCVFISECAFVSSWHGFRLLGATGVSEDMRLATTHDDLGATAQIVAFWLFFPQISSSYNKENGISQYKSAEHNMQLGWRCVES